MTERQEKVLRFLSEHAKSDKWFQGVTPANIAYGIGITNGPRRRGNGAAGKGGWSGYMSPAQHVIFTLNSLREKGLISFGSRPDGLSGTAYSITDEGVDALVALDADKG